MKMLNVQVENMRSTSSGSPVANQFLVITNEGSYFQSYSTVIAFKEVGGKVFLDPRWDCSVTTGKYRNQFLGESIAETRKKIESGEYTIMNLNL